MERHRYLRPTFITVLCAVLIGISLRWVTAQGAQAISLKACPVLPVKITGVEVTPRQPARLHAVKVTWAVSTPECFTLQRFAIKGTLTFANGQSKSFAQSVGGNQGSLQFQVTGLLPTVGQPSSSQTPVKAEVGVSGIATASVAGDSSPACTECDVPATVSSCLPLAHVQNVQAVFSGLLVSPENPVGTHFPKVKVSWQTSALPSCYKIESFSVTAKIRTSAGLRSKTVTVSGNQTATEIVFDNFPVSADFTPGLIVASLRPSGTATITGNDQKESQLN